MHSFWFFFSAIEERKKVAMKREFITRQKKIRIETDAHISLIWINAKFESNFLECHSLLYNIYLLVSNDDETPRKTEWFAAIAKKSVYIYKIASALLTQILEEICKTAILTLSEKKEKRNWRKKIVRLFVGAISIEMLILLDMHSKTSRFCLFPFCLLRGHNML